MGLFNRKNKADAELLKQIREILFPDPVIETVEDGKRVFIDFSVDLNLDAVHTDLEDGYVDEISRKTVRELATRLHQVRKLMNVQVDLPPDIEYITVVPCKDE